MRKRRDAANFIGQTISSRRLKNAILLCGSGRGIRDGGAWSKFPALVLTSSLPLEYRPTLICRYLIFMRCA